MERKEFISHSATLKQNIISACAHIDLSKLQEHVQTLETEMSDTNFWDNASSAQNTIEELKRYKSRVETWSSLLDSVTSLEELLLMSEDSDLPLLAEEYQTLVEKYEKASLLLYFTDPYDKEDCIFSIVSGAGGDDAEDFAGMLLRMYTMYFDSHQFSYDIYDISEGAGSNGIKKVTMEIRGDFPYGTLKVEKGVHRLVRLSPFKSSDSRQTSFALVEVLPFMKNVSKDDVIIEEKDLRIDTFRSSGAGGQKVNKTDSAVRLTHIPTGISVSCQVERSQHQNKERAMEALRSRLYQLKLEQQAKMQEGVKGEVLSVDWGKQIRSYVLHPYKMVKDHRTEVESSQVEKIFNGELDEFIEAGIRLL